MSMFPALPPGPPVEEPKTTQSTVVAFHSGQSRHDSKYYCTCPPEEMAKYKDISQIKHPKTCPVWQFDDWREIRCEWDPKKKGWLYACKCVPEATGLKCEICGVQKYYEKGPWLPINDGTYYGANSWQGTTSYVGGQYGGYVQKCRHMEQEVTYPDGTRLFASSEMSHEKPKGIPDFALYAYDGWRPRSLATIIPWKDFGLPTCPWPVAAGAIKEAYGLAKEGWSVEVGCAGGHGRTGTILACMAVIAGIPAINAVDWVKEHYCEEAVEGEVQEWWVLWFECWHLGLPTPHTLPEKPKPEPIKAAPVKSTVSTSPKALTKAEKKEAKKKAKKAKETVANALADGSPITMDQYAEYLKTAPDADDPAVDLADVEWDDDFIGDEADAAAYLAWQARCTDAGEEPAPVVQEFDPMDWSSDVDPETEARWERAWDLIEEGPWPTGETDEEFWKRVNRIYDDLVAQEDAAASEGLDTDDEDEDIEVSGMGIFRSFFGLK